MRSLIESKAYLQYWPTIIMLRLP